MAMDGSGYSLSDIAAITGNGEGFGGGNSFLLMIILFALLGGNGFGGWGNNGFANAIGYENLATSNEVQRGFDNQNSMANQREILAAVNAGTMQATNATNEVFHNLQNALSDKYSELQRDIAGVGLGVQQAIANQQQCCCETKMLIADTAAQQRYESAMQNNAVLQAVQAEGAATRAMIQQDKIEGLQQQVQQLQLAQAVAGVVRYPDSWAYNAGTSPFCGCNQGCGCNI